MTTLLDAEETGSAVRTTTPRDLWRAARVLVVAGALLLGIALLSTILTGTATVAPLDPKAAGPQGARALATLLRERGIDVRKVVTPSSLQDTTVFVPIPETLQPETLATISALNGDHDVVLVGPQPQRLVELAVPATVVDVVAPAAVEPGCDEPVAATAGDALIGGFQFEAGTAEARCYPVDGRPSYVVLTRRDVRFTLLGAGDGLTNEHLGQRGNAALGLGLLSRHPVLEWVYPGPPVSLSGRHSLWSLMPRGVHLAFAELLVAALLAALWRGRRLGPVVVEPLPVVVRAAEAVEGRARLYASARARDQAAAALRAGLRDRLVRALGLPPDAAHDALLAAVGRRTRRAATDLDVVLYGPPPTDDAGLVRLAADLDSLEREVRTT